MGKAVISVILLGFISGLTSGAGVLPDGPLNASVGGTVMFTVSPVEGQLFSVEWQFKGKQIFTSNPAVNTTLPGYEGRIFYFPSTGSLELKTVSVNDSGEYGVSISAESGAHEGSVTLDVYEPVSNVTVSVSGTDLLESDSVQLSCSVSAGSSPLHFLWTKSSSEVTASDRVQITATDEVSNLTITNVTRYDEGTYNCTVSNLVSSETSDGVNLILSYGPENTILHVTPSQEEYKEGEDITLSCSADSRPEAQFKWFVNEEELTNTGSELRLTNLQTDDSGSYSCMASNSRTSKSERSAPVSVNVTQSGDVPAPPCPPGCIAGIVIACLVVCGGAAAAGYFVYKKKVRKPQPTATVELQQAKQGHIYENMSLGRTVGQQQANQGHVYENMPSGRKEGQAKEQHVYENPSPVYAKK